MNKSPIEWTEYTSNPIQAYADGKRGWFCEKVSPGCAHCYSSTQNEVARWGGNGLAFLPANRERVEFRLNEDELAEWSRKRLAGPGKGEPMYTGRCFAFDMTDLFGEWVGDEWLDKTFAAMMLAPNLDFQILTKRPDRMLSYLVAPGRHGAILIAAKRMGATEAPTAWPLPNVWLGVTVENQRWADHRIPILLDTPAAVRFVSAEPLLGPVDFKNLDWTEHYLAKWQALQARESEPSEVIASIIESIKNRGDAYAELDALTNFRTDGEDVISEVGDARLDWVIVGGESGSKHRAFDPAWARSIVAQCADAGVACFVKQLGGARPGNRLEDLPADLRVREFPR